MEKVKGNRLYGWYIVFINALVGCVLSAGFPQFSMSVPYMAEKMGVTQEALLAGDTIKTISVVLSMMLSGVAYKKFGAKKVFAFSMTVAIIPLFILPHVDSIMIQYILKFIQGFASLVFPVFLLIIMDWVSESETGLATAVFNGIFYGGGGIGGTFAGFVITKWGWVSSFYALGILQAVISVVWIITVKEKGGKKEVAEDTKGETISYGKLLKMPLVWFFVFGFLSTTWLVQAISVDMTLFGSYLNYGEMEIGKIMTAVTIGIISACVVSGKAADFAAARNKSKAIGRVSVLMIGCILIVVSTILLLTLPLENFSVFYFCVLLLSFSGSWGLGCFYSILPEVFSDDTLPVATGFIGGCGDAGMTFAPIVVGIIFGVKGLWNIGWGICGAVGFVSVICCILIINKLKKENA